MIESEKIFSEYYIEHIDEIFRFVFFSVNQHKQTAEDLTSIIFIKAFKYRKKFDSRKSSFRTFLFHIARNTIIDHYRTSKISIPLKEEEIDSAPFLSEKIDAVLFWKHARRTLSESAYHILILRFKNEIPIQEIATIIGTTEDAVKSSLKRSKKKLVHLFSSL